MKEHNTINSSRTTSASANDTNHKQSTLDNVANTSQIHTAISSPPRKRGRKRRRRTSGTSTLDDSSSTTKPTDSLTFLPLELLREILVGTRSTRDILSVARCNKHLWKTLTGSPADFIWKGTRRVAISQPLPDPPRQLSEPAYAAMLFDGGLCEICKKYTKESYLSFALQLRICTNERCRKITPDRHFFKLLPIDQEHVLKIHTRTVEVDIPVLNQNFDPNTKKYWPQARAWCRTQEWLKSASDYSGAAKAEENAEDRKRRHQEAVEKKNEWMKFCVALHKWRETYRTAYFTNKRLNHNLVTNIAQANKVNVNDLASTSFGALHLIRDKCLEPLTVKDFDVVAARVKEELEELAKKRKESTRCASYRSVWEAIQRYYHQLRSGGPKVVLPPYATFRRLPQLASLLTITNSDTAKSIQNILKQDGLKNVISAQLEKWESDARRNMAALLGYPDWTSGSQREEANEVTEVVHPVDRATARFLCKACSERARRYEREFESLTFVKACSHECPRVDGKKQRFVPWDASSFVKDDKAVAAIKRALEICEFDEALTVWEMLGERRIKCTSCKPFSFMTFDGLIVHCHRHENMEIASGKDEEMDATLKPLMAYLSNKNPHDAYKLMIRRGKEGDVKDCGCKHCLFVEALKFPDEDAQSLFKGIRKMTVNGLRSHLKAKHGFAVLRDEDVFIFPVAEGNSG